jgi:CHRD domain
MKSRPTPPGAATLAATVLMSAAASVSAHDGIDARLRGYQEVPSVSTAAKGRLKASVDDKSGAIRYELSYSGLEGTVTQAHIHFGQHGVNGGIMVWLCQTATNADPTGLAPTCPQSGTVTGVLQANNVIGPAGQGVAVLEFAEVLAAIRAGVAYANVHSSKFPGGEIRAQLRDDD